ncbi:MAG: sigma-70 family RNA polymerase sigma factor [Myxococcaceae bacterium]|nr:sigma-70 family RNA polymerase sigma factor [Myxococcaceae bacterium]
MANEVTELLAKWRAGESGAAEAMFPLVFDELRRIARRQFKGERADHTLQPTAVLNEAWLKLIDQRAEWKNRSHFFAVAAQTMRRVLVDHARKKRAARREAPVLLEEPSTSGDPVDVIALDEALEALGRLDARQVRVVELKYFAGLENEEIAEALDVSLPTVKRDWQTARAFLFRALREVK